MVISLFGKFTGFLREAVMASSVGANIYTDAYIYALTISGLLTSVILAGFNTALIPVLSEAEKYGERDQFFNRMLSISIPFIGFLTLMVFIFTPQLLHILAPGISDDIRSMTEYFARILSVCVFFQGFQALLVGYLQKQSKFLFPAAMAFPLNFAIIAGTLLSSPDYVTPMVVGTAIGQGLTLLWLLIPLNKTGFKFNWDFEAKDKYIRLFLAMIGPILISMTAYQINVAVDRALASYLPGASASYLNYAAKIQNLFNSVFIVSVASVIFKSQSEIASERNFQKAYKLTKDNLMNMMLFIVPVVTGVMFLSKEIIQIALMRNNFTTEDATITGNILFLYALLIFFYAINDMITRLYFSFKETKKPVLTTIITVVVNIVANLVLMRYLGVYGLALATVLAAAVGSVLLIYYIYKDDRFEGKTIFTKSMFQFLLSGLAMLLTLWGLKSYVLYNLSLLPYAVVIAVAGATVYMGALALLKNEEFQTMIGFITAKLDRIRRAEKK